MFGAVVYIVFRIHEVSSYAAFQGEVFGELYLDEGIAYHTVVLVECLLLIKSLQQVVVQQVHILDGICPVFLVRDVPWPVFQSMRKHGCTHVSIRHMMGMTVVRTDVDACRKPLLDIGPDICPDSVFFSLAAYDDSLVVACIR